MKFDGFDKLRQSIDELNDIKNTNKVDEIINEIDISNDNFNNWVDIIFSKEVEKLDIDKLPYILDALYKSNDKLKVFLFCMLLEALSNKLPFITKLEDYPLFKEKYELLLRTLVLTYESCNNGIGNCMALIILNNDPEFKYLDDEGKGILINASINKLDLIINFLKKNKKVDQTVYDDLEVIIDLACYLNSNEIDKLVNEVDSFDLNDSCNIFVIKYKAIRNLNVNFKKVNKIILGVELEKLFGVLEKINRLDILPLEKISQEMIAKSKMINWLVYPTELGKIPDEIELLCEFEFNDSICYAYKFKSKSFRIKDYMLGISGGFKKDSLTSFNTSLTFSKFEVLEKDYLKQAKELAKFIDDYWKNRNK